jgi:hypothetical protein
MSVVLRFVSLILIVVALMLLGADMITSLELHGRITVRSLDQVWALVSRAGLADFKGWLEQSLPAPVVGWIGAALSLPAWALTGVLGVVLAFLFGRRPAEEA